MREIKFRVFISHFDRPPEMAEVDYYFFEEWGYRTSEDVEEAGHVLMQYTGLLDKNGKEIYEGDIVRPVDPTDWYDERYKSSNYRIVEWSAPEFEPFDTYSLREGPYGFPPEDCEVIGNIYENPELLEKT